MRVICTDILLLRGGIAQKTAGQNKKLTYLDVIWQHVSSACLGIGKFLILRIEPVDKWLDKPALQVSAGVRAFKRQRGKDRE